ncbi:hypothetical protein [Clostridium saccharoperbutylacetonicum]|uniref:hypothetical protein n=1 Tax=Clostridium saccharoperbutylacetonicum TaxID=36745 RepID=UPI0003755A57|nr:hypothetical protein [Clostridium saccharoperbutylacetonicum]NRT62047.1 hypothetical protein [Clostridium saccharoperbutylacetonicum]NSB25377.1 hypothetical protein [Clostridium saccharoperbutylacetonicum]NSB31744.1 hypothetical protein [Clostridium saccharoperbutylacetonicum]NSB44745.1 hypothetical protein [Clostridium saccharoperbutylacetonicum]
MKRFISIFLFFFCLFFANNTMTYAEISKDSIQGIYTLNTLNLSPDINYVIQNNSFNERALLIIYDSKPNLIQLIRLTPQSKKHNLIPLKNDYTIVILGRGLLDFSQEAPS